VLGFLIGFFIGVQPKVSRTAEVLADVWMKGR